ncbi:MAG: type IV pilus assembly protein PilM [Pirellulales bacterium]|nr:type IV pilus assembly protein PilM [Pirellulales bacterium]
MVGFPKFKHVGPIGVDLGSRTVKLLQFDDARGKLLEAARAELRLPADAAPADVEAGLVAALQQVRQSHNFVGRDAVVCLGTRQLVVQNIRVPKVAASQFAIAVRDEAASRLPFPLAEAELRYLEAADVRQGDELKREVILLACHRPVLDGTLNVIERAGLRPVAVDAEPVAILRCFSRQFRRESDQQICLMLVHIGVASTVVIISRGGKAMFIKYLDISGCHFDEALARHLKMDLAEAAALRRQQGDARPENCDPDIDRAIRDATRRVLDQLGQELALCARYYSVTFRGQPIHRVMLSGGEADANLLEALSGRLEIPCELGNPWREVGDAHGTGRRTQWDVATGLALRPLN